MPEARRDDNRSRGIDALSDADIDEWKKDRGYLSKANRVIFE